MSEETKRIIVGDHINELLREGREHRLEHELRDGRASSRAPANGRGPARVRLGHWLIGVGSAVAGNTAEAPDGSPG
ncbi:MAG TPA: hypothetical protein VGQ64_10740 [Candidatus Limnocylindrales bacterium]|jgi:hypothetical protein|nr:hypothetical protein [Candidatus Limnocylindrales bacterium]